MSGYFYSFRSSIQYTPHYKQNNGYSCYFIKELARNDSEATRQREEEDGKTLVCDKRDRATEKGLAPVVRKVDSAIQRINHYPLDSAIGCRNT